MPYTFVSQADMAYYFPWLKVIFSIYSIHTVNQWVIIIKLPINLSTITVSKSKISQTKEDDILNQSHKTWSLKIYIDRSMLRLTDPYFSNYMEHVISMVRTFLTLHLPTVAGAGHQNLFPGEEHQRPRGWGPDVKDQRPAAPWRQAGWAQAGGGLQEPL